MPVDEAVRNLCRGLFRRGRESTEAPAALDMSEAGQGSAEGAIGPLPEADGRAAMERIAPFGELMFLMMASDGECADAERRVLRRAMRVCPTGMSVAGTGPHPGSGLCPGHGGQGRSQRLSVVAGYLAADRQDADAALSLAAAVASGQRGHRAPRAGAVGGLRRDVGVAPKRDPKVA